MNTVMVLSLLSSLAAGPGIGIDHLVTNGVHAAGPEATPEEGGWGEEDTVPDEAPAADTEPAPTDPATAPADPATDPTVAPAPAPAPAGTPGTAAGGTGIVQKPAPEPGNKKGLGLMIAAGGVGAIAWGATAATAGLLSNSCAKGATVDNAGDTFGKCVTKATSILGLIVLKWLANDATYGLAPAAGLVRGRWEASDYVYSGNHDRKGTMLAAIGGGALGAGIIGKVVLWGLLPNTLRCPVDLGYGPCVRRRWVGYIIGQQVMSSTIAAGAGLLAFGVYYGKERKARERLFFRPDQVRIVPSMSPQFSGMSLAGRF